MQDTNDERVPEFSDELKDALKRAELLQELADQAIGDYHLRIARRVAERNKKLLDALKEND